MASEIVHNGHYRRHLLTTLGNIELSCRVGLGVIDDNVVNIGRAMEAQAAP